MNIQRIRYKSATKYSESYYIARLSLGLGSCNTKNVFIKFFST